MIWITGGGTGGHLFPALNIAEELLRRHPELDVRFIGAARGLEARLLPERGYPHTLLPVAGDVRRGIGERVSFFARLAASLARCERLLRTARPRLVLGTGGYASFPAAQIAAWHGVPLFWQEQNAHPGAVTRRLARHCRSIFTGFPGLDSVLGGDRVIFTGNPIRAQVLSGDRWRGRQQAGFAREDRVLLVLGGSGGAASINRAVARIADVLSRKGGLRIWWQVGEREFEHWNLTMAPELFPGTMMPFIEHMGDAYAAADMVLARAGAMTTSEICAVGKPAVLVPFPHAAADHQSRNVEALVAEGAVMSVRDDELETPLLAETLLALAADATLQARLAAAARRMGRPRAAADIAERLEPHL